MINQTEHILDDLKNGKTDMASNFYSHAIKIPNLQMYSTEEGIYAWTAWDMGTKYEYAYDVCRMLCDIAVANYARGEI